MSQSALKYAIRDTLRSRLSKWIVAPKDIRIMGDAQPAARSGLLFVAIHGFSSRNTGSDTGYRLEETPRFSVTISMRSAWIDKYKVFESYLDDPEGGIEFITEQVKTLHGDFTVASLANTFIAGGSSGYVEGSMLSFEIDFEPVSRDHDWWGSSTKPKKPGAFTQAGWSKTLNFSGPERVRTVNELGTH